MYTVLLIVYLLLATVDSWPDCVYSEKKVHIINTTLCIL